MKKAFAVLLSVVMLLCVIPVYSFGAGIVDSGNCGDNLTYTLDDEGTLTIEGYGPMWDFGTEEHPRRPWDYYSPANYDENMVEVTPEISDIRIINHIILPNGLTEIGDGAFEFFMGNEIEIPGNVTRIGSYAFSCSYLEAINIPNSVFEIGSYAFQGCAQLKQVCLSESLREISDYLFYWAGVEKITLPKQIELIGEWAFANCLWLGEIDLPSQLQDIDSYAFCGARLDSITIPQSCSKLEADCFEPWYLLYHPMESITILNDDIELKDLGVESFSFAWTLEKVRQYELIMKDSAILKSNTDVSNMEFPTKADEISQLQAMNLLHRTTWKSIEEYDEDIPLYHANAIAEINSILGTSFETRNEVIDVDTLEETEAFFSAYKSYFGSTQQINGFTYPWFTVYGHGGATSEAYANSIGATFVCLHEDNDENGYCDFCGKNLNGTDEPVDPNNGPTGEKCKYCGEIHGNDFIGRLTSFFHSILFFFAHLFGKM